MTVYIPNPCHENWNNMVAAEKGKFCNACAKQVIDFSMMSDNQILNYFKTSTGRTCGRFAQDQLQRSLQPMVQPTKKAWWMALAMPLLLLFDKSSAQESRTVGDTVIVTPQIKEPELMGKIMVRSCELQADKNIVVKGKLVDENGNAISYASIFCKRINLGTVSDSAGNFKTTSKKISVNDIINISAIGFESVDVAVKDLLSEQNIILKIQSATLGDVVVTQMGGAFAGVPVKKIDTLKTQIKQILSPNSFKVYPNPATAGSFLNIQIKQKGDFQIMLFDENANLISAEEHDSNNAKTILMFQLPAFILPGIYYLKAEGLSTKKSFTQKIIIQ